MRIAIFVDGRNFYSGWRDAAGGRRIDFARLARWVTRRAGGDRLWGTFYYTGVEPTAPDAAEDVDGPRAPETKSLVAFLDMLERQPGYFVKRLPRRILRTACEECGKETRTTEDKEVATTLVADLIRLAAIGAYDAVVLISGDADYAPAIEAARGFGKQAFVASWGGAGLANRLRREAFDHIDLLDGIESFSTPQTPGANAERPPAPPRRPALDAAREPDAGHGDAGDDRYVDVGAFLDDDATSGGDGDEDYGDGDDGGEAADGAADGPEDAPGADDDSDDGDALEQAVDDLDEDGEEALPEPRPASYDGGSTRRPRPAPAAPARRGFGPPGRRADPATEEVFLAELARAANRFPYVGLNYFLTRWRSPVLDPDAERRSRMLDDLVDRGRIEIYEAPDGNKAIRLGAAAGSRRAGG